MPEVTYVKFSGEVITVTVNDGDSVMQGAVDNMIEGIEAECGGSGSCGTCHCYVDEEWIDRVKGPDEHEIDMLDCVAHVKSGSRLSCQLVVSNDLNGLVVRLPEKQSF